MEQSKNKSAAKSPAIMLILLCWLVYATSYLGKVNYSANITQVIDFYGVNKAQAGIVPTFFFFAYGVGQVINGIFCKRYNIKWMIFASLFVSGTVNLIIAISPNFDIVKWLWLINGIALSVLWPTLIRQLSEALPKRLLGLSSVVIGTTVATGTLIIYGLSSIYAAFDKFKLSFYTAAIAVFVVGIIWVIFYNKTLSLAENEKAKETCEAIEEKAENKEPEKAEQRAGEKKILFATIYILCFYAVGVNLIKDGLTTWVPSILKEEFFMSDSISILLTLFLPILAIFGNAFSLKMHKKIPDYINQCAVAFGVMAVFILIIIGSLSLKAVLFMLVSLILVNFFAATLNSLITSIFPLFKREKINSGLICGVLNGFSYLGSTLSSYGLGLIADKFGWLAVFIALFGFMIVVFIIWIIYLCFKRYLINK